MESPGELHDAQAVLLGGQGTSLWAAQRVTALLAESCCMVGAPTLTQTLGVLAAHALLVVCPREQVRGALQELAPQGAHLVRVPKVLARQLG